MANKLAGIEEGMTLCAIDAVDGKFHLAVVAAVRSSRRSARGQVRVQYVSSGVMEWVSADTLKKPDLSRLTADLKLHAEYSGDGKHYAAEVVEVSTKKAEVLIHWAGWTQDSDEWIGVDRIRSKKLNWISPQSIASERDFREGHANAADVQVDQQGGVDREDHRGHDDRNERDRHDDRRFRGGRDRRRVRVAHDSGRSQGTGRDRQSFGAHAHQSEREACAECVVDVGERAEAELNGAAATSTVEAGDRVELAKEMEMSPNGIKAKPDSQVHRVKEAIEVAAGICAPSHGMSQGVIASIKGFLVSPEQQAKWVEEIEKGTSLAALPRDAKEDLAVVLAAVKRNGRALRYAESWLKNDRSIVQAAVRQNGCAVQFASARLQADRSLIREAVAQDGHALGVKGADEFQADREVVLTAVTQCGFILCKAVDELRADREIVLAAVSSFAKALQFASIERRAEREVVLSAVAQSGDALEWVSRELRADREVVLAAIAQRRSALRFASKALQAEFSRG